MAIPLPYSIAIYVFLILLMEFIKSRFPDSTFVHFFKKYGWWLIGLCFIVILALAAGPQFQSPFNALDVPIIGVMLVFGYFFFKDHHTKK